MKLSLSVRLTHLGSSFGSLPSFSQFAEQFAESKQRRFLGPDGRAKPPRQLDPLAVEEVRIRWQQKLPRPRVRSYSP